MSKTAFAAVCAGFLGLAAPAMAADFSDPTWPCVQRKVETLSMGLMWPHLLDESAEYDSQARADIAELADRLALRRTDPSALEPQVAAFAEAYGGNADMLGRVFEKVFNGLSSRRTQIIAGIGDFSLGQIALSEKIDEMRVAMDSEMALAEPDFDKVDALEEQLDWDQLIYTDRQQSITYLCETPVLLEKRLYAIARILQNEIRAE
jgi:hypothetical protein